MKAFLLLVFVAILAYQATAEEQRVIVKGRLICGDRPASNVKVKLYDIGEPAVHKRPLSA